MQKSFFRSLVMLVVLNLLVKPVWIFAIDRQVQNITGFSAYGEYFALLNLCIILNFLLDFGISSYFNREVASRSKDGIVLFSQAFNGKFLLAAIYVFVTFTVAFLSGISNYRLLFMLMLMQVGSSFLLFVRAYLTAAQHFRSDAFISVIDKFFVIVGVGALMLLPGISGGVTIQRFVIIQMAGILLAIVTGIVLLVRNVPGFVFRPFSGFNRKILWSSMPFALNVFFMTMMSRADGFLLERIHENGATEAGIYAAAYRLLDAFNMVGFLMAGFLLPYISRHWPNINRFSGILLICRHALVLGSMLVVSFVLAAPEYLTDLLYHRSDNYVSTIITIVMFSLPGLSMIHIYGTTLTATRNMNIFLRLSIVFALLNLTLNFIFIPEYGAQACGYIAVCTNTGYALAVIYFARMRTGVRLALTYIPVYLAAGVLCFAIIKTAEFLNLNILLSALIASALISVIILRKAGVSLRQMKKMLLE